MIKEIQSMSKNLKSVITCDLDGKIETFSKGAQQLFGYTEEEIDNGAYPYYLKESSSRL